jgi:hypothetical protein
MLDRSLEEFEGGSEGYYRCNHCKQWWYLVFSDEELSQPIFGVRSSEESRRSAILGSKSNPEVQEASRQMMELLFGNSETQLCRLAGCHLPALQGLALCSSHYSLPW